MLLTVGEGQLLWTLLLVMASNSVAVLHFIFFTSQEQLKFILSFLIIILLTLSLP